MPGSDLIQSVLRAADLLALLARHPEGLSLSELSERLDAKAPTAHKLLSTLSARGFVERTTEPVRYRLGAAALEMAGTYWDRGLLSRGESALRRLAEVCPAATLTLTCPVGEQLLALLRISPARPGFIERPTGQVMQPYATASGLLFQAFWGPEESAQLQERYPFWRHGAHLWGSQRRLDAFLARARRLGCVAPDLEGKNLWILAAPVFGPGGALKAALGVALPSGRATPALRTELVERVTSAASSLSEPGGEKIEQS